MKANVVSRVVAVIGCVALSVTVAHAGSGQGGGFGFAGFQCYSIKGDGLTQPRTVDLTDQFGTRTVEVDTGRLLCTPLLTGTVLDGPELGIIPATADHLKCYDVFKPGRPGPSFVASVTDQLDIETVTVSTPVLLCVHAVKEFPVP